MASVYTMMAYQVESIFHVKSVYTLPWPKVSTLCRHEDLVVYIMMWHWVSTFWCHQRVDKVSTFWWHVSSLSSHLSSLWCHQAMSTFCSHTKCLPYEALPFCTVAFVLKISSKSIQILTWECLGCLRKQKGSRNSNLLSNCTVFQPKLNKAWKTFQNDQISWKRTDFDGFSKFIQF